MIRSLLEFLGLWEAEPCRRAREQFQASHPTLQTCGTSLRATEENRFVVAVFYFDPQRPVKPLPYELFGVSKDLMCADELPMSLDSPYRIRGHR